MTKLNEKINVCDLVIANTKIAKVFDKYKIDYCCGGKLTLQEACQKKGIDFEVVWKEVQQINEENEVNVDLDNYSLSELVEHILNTHHKYLNEELPLIKNLLDKIVQKHGQNHQELQKLHDVFHQFLAEISEHMVKEEEILFPWILQLDSGSNVPDSPCGSIQNPIQVMEHEHLAAGALLIEMRNLTNDYTPPIDACNSFRILFQKLLDLEIDLHRHIHKENHILFPKTIKREELK